MDANHPEITLETLKGTFTRSTDVMCILLAGGEETDPQTAGIISHQIVLAQAENYRQNYFDGVNVREDMMRYLYFYFFQDDKEPKYGNQDDLSVMLDKTLWSERADDEHRVAQKIKYSIVNEEAAYIIGFVLIVTSMMKIAREQTKTIKLEIEEPFFYIDQIGRFTDLLTLIIADGDGIISKTETK